MDFPDQLTMLDASTPPKRLLHNGKRLSRHVFNLRTRSRMTKWTVAGVGQQRVIGCIWRILAVGVSFSDTPKPWIVCPSA